MRREWASWTGFGAAVAPLTTAAAVSSWLGAQWLAPRMPSGLEIPLALCALLCYLGVVAVGERPLPAVALLLCFAGLVGALLAGWLLPHLDPVWRPAILGALACLSAAFVLANLLAGRVAVPGRLLGSASLLYLFGWLGLVISQAGAGAYRIWAAVGVVMFIALTFRWLTDVDAVDVEAAPRQAASLYLLGLNLTIALALTLGLTGG